MNAKTTLPPVDAIDPDNPPLTAEQLARFRPAREVLSPEFLDGWEDMRQRAINEQRLAGKRWVTFEIDDEVFAHFLELGSDDFDLRMNAALRQVMNEQRDASPIPKPRRERA